MTYKSLDEVMLFLKAALKSERTKWKASIPSANEMYKPYIAAQAWGSVVSGYHLMEVALKAVGHFTGKGVKKGHSLQVPFNRLNKGEKEALNEYYTDFMETQKEVYKKYPYKKIEKFLKALDGDRNQEGNFTGSFSWRYFPTEQHKNVPGEISIDLMHEIVEACIQLIRATKYKGRKTRWTKSWRLHHERKVYYDYQQMMTIKLNTETDKTPRREILWGPDYQGRYDLCCFDGRGWFLAFAKIPNDKIKKIDKRKEVESYNPAEGWEELWRRNKNKGHP